MTEPPIPVHEFFAAIYGHFVRDVRNQPSALDARVHRALQEEHYASLAREHSSVYAEAFQVAVIRLSYRERPAYHAYFGLVLEVFEQRYGPGSAPVRGSSIATRHRRTVSVTRDADERRRSAPAHSRRRDRGATYITSAIWRR